MSLVVGLDVGTQSVKLVALDLRRVGRCHAWQALQLIAADDGSREQQLPQWWIDAIRDCFANTGYEPSHPVTAIGVSGQQHGFVPLDAAGKVLAPAKLWCDTSTQVECAQIMPRRAASRDALSWPATRSWSAIRLRNCLDAARTGRMSTQRLATILLPHDYVNFWLTGERWMESGRCIGHRLAGRAHTTLVRAMLAATDADRDLAACLPPLDGGQRQFSHRRQPSPSQLGLPAGRTRFCRRRRQHDGRHRHRQCRARSAHHEPRHFRHPVRLRRPCRWSMTQGRLGCVLLVDRRLAAADLHDELHRRHGKRGARLRLRQPRRRMR